MVLSRPDLPTQTAYDLDEVASAALAEDLGESGADVTTMNVVDPDLMGEAVIIAKKAGVVSGFPIAARVFELIVPPCEFRRLVVEGARVSPGDEVARITGPLASVLVAERTALNFMQRMSGIATLTRRYADSLEPYPKTTLLDTRKTTPGLRALERAAVRAGGGHNHRSGLWDAILIKDNHVAAAGGVGPAISRARRSGLPVEVEVESIDQLNEALAAGAETILLDNMSTDLMRRAVEITAGRARLEASGGMSVEGAVAAAQAGVDRISVGALTHSAPALDLSLEVVKTWRKQ
jgi:nicotinate-nucleotide pyrophosphorylase (carboxylating)